MRCNKTIFGLAALACAVVASAASDAPRLTIAPGDGRYEILADGSPVATYVINDPSIPRPYFTALRAPGGVEITRPQPPREGMDLTDHPTFHPGIWLAFGDISGADFWRNEAMVTHEGFTELASTKPDRVEFEVRNAYRNGSELICLEKCHYTIMARPEAYFLLADSEFTNPDATFTFGDQEEMGLGIRVATELTVKAGKGKAVNTAGDLNEDGAWGKQADWAAFFGEKDSMNLCAVMMPHPDNFRQCWFHIRDTGLIIANPFGANAYTGGAKSAVKVSPGEEFRLRYGVALASASPPETPNPAQLYSTYLELVGND